MFYEGDTVEVTKLHPDVQEILEDALEADFEDITFYFVECADDDDYVVLSAETNDRFAIIQCPVDAIKGFIDYSEDVEKLLDHVINTHILNRALDTRNRELFNAVAEYRNAPKEKKEPKPQHIYMDVVYDVSENEGWDRE